MKVHTPGLFLTLSLLTVTSMVTVAKDIDGGWGITNHPKTGRRNSYWQNHLVQDWKKQFFNPV